MTSDQITKSQLLLESRLAGIEEATSTLRKDLLEAAEVMPTILQNGFDHAKIEGDLSARIEVHELNMAARDRLRAALTRITNGAYGRCMGCEEPISTKRLEVQPEASLCVECQSTLEGRAVVRESRIGFLHLYRRWAMREEAA